MMGKIIDLFSKIKPKSKAEKIKDAIAEYLERQREIFQCICGSNACVPFQQIFRLDSWDRTEASPIAMLLCVQCDKLSLYAAVDHLKEFL
jgi:hypothetical protein